jgi:hypothetical protein
MSCFCDFRDIFISPLSGRIRQSGLPFLETDYIWMGDVNTKAMPSPIIIDIRLDIINILTNLSQTKFILQTPMEGFGNAQALDELEDGILKHVRGVVDIAIPGEDFLTPSLSQGKLWIGDSNNKPAEQPTISIDNLPNLGVAAIPGLEGLAGKIWRGTISGRPEESNAVSILEADVLAINARFLTAAWILRKAPVEILWPTAQFINHLPENRILTHTTDGTIGVASLTENYFWIGDANNVPVETLMLPIGNLPDLTYKYLWLGDINNRPVEQPTISIDNLPDLSFQAIWRGNATGRPEESQSLTILEAKVTFIQNVTIPGIEAEIVAIQGQITVIEGEIALLQGAVVVLQGQVAGLLLSVANLSSRVSTLEDSVSTLQSQVSTLISQVSVIQGQIVAIQAALVAINTRIDNLRLNTIPADGDVSFYNFKLINLADPVNPTDGVNLRTMQAAIGGAIGNITLDGFVLGDSDETGLIHTTRGPLCLLTNIPAGGDVSIDGYRLTNVGDYTADRDALTIEGFWDLIHLPNLYVAAVNPEVMVLGPVQQFSFDMPRSVFEIANTSTPTASISSLNILEFKNSHISGYRLLQESSIVENSGDFHLERFENGQETGEKILSFIESDDQLQLEKVLNANNQRIVNVQEEPQADQDAISFLFLWRVLNDEVF